MNTSNAVTPGQEFVDVSFNPEQREDVKLIKQAFANAYDTIEVQVSQKLNAPAMLSTEKVGKIKRLEAVAKTQLELSCMAAVKAVTR